MPCTRSRYLRPRRIEAREGVAKASRRRRGGVVAASRWRRGGIAAASWSCPHGYSVQSVDVNVFVEEVPRRGGSPILRDALKDPKRLVADACAIRSRPAPVADPSREPRRRPRAPRRPQEAAAGSSARSAVPRKPPRRRPRPPSRGRHDGDRAAAASSTRPRATTSFARAGRRPMGTCRRRRSRRIAWAAPRSLGTTCPRTARTTGRATASTSGWAGASRRRGSPTCTPRVLLS